ncbi:hypothetical protein EDD15DRAFT_2194888 [Pisolithus albus]|nr:hypothetical protein EDD15DRAFT_2194888 [Pisolithus albus]
MLVVADSEHAYLENGWAVQYQAFFYVLHLRCRVQPSIATLHIVTGPAKVPAACTNVQMLFPPVRRHLQRARIIQERQRYLVSCLFYAERHRHTQYSESKLILKGIPAASRGYDGRRASPAYSTRSTGTMCNCSDVTRHLSHDLRLVQTCWTSVIANYEHHTYPGSNSATHALGFYFCPFLGRATRMQTNSAREAHNSSSRGGGSPKLYYRYDDPHRLKQMIALLMGSGMAQIRERNTEVYIFVD